MNWTAWTMIGLVLYAVAGYCGKDRVTNHGMFAYNMSLGCCWYTASASAAGGPT